MIVLREAATGRRMEVLIICFTCGREYIKNEKLSACPKCASRNIHTLFQYAKETPEKEKEMKEKETKKNTVTEEQIDAIMEMAEFSEFPVVLGKTTVVAAKLPNGFVIVESSSCVDPENYDHDLGVKLCKERIRNKIWELEGYALQKELDILRPIDERPLGSTLLGTREFQEETPETPIKTQSPSYIPAKETWMEKSLATQNLGLLSALQLVFNGDMVRREAWQDKNTHVSMHSNQLSLRKSNGWHSWIISIDDVEAHDWQVFKGFVSESKDLSGRA